MYAGCGVQGRRKGRRRQTSADVIERAAGPPALDIPTPQALTGTGAGNRPRHDLVVLSLIPGEAETRRGPTRTRFAEVFCRVGVDMDMGSAPVTVDALFPSRVSV